MQAHTIHHDMHHSDAHHSGDNQYDAYMYAEYGIER